MKRFLGITSAALLTASAAATEVTRFDFDANVVGSPARNLSYSQVPAIGALLDPGDGFQPFQVFVSATIPFALVDDTCAAFPADSQGIVQSTKFDAWFGVCDLNNPDNTSGTGSVTMTFDISGFTDLSVSIDMAAMGDFEIGSATVTPDFNNFTYQIDAGAVTPLFTTSIDEAIDKNYTLECNPVPFLVADPMSCNGTELSNIFQTLTANVSGSGSVLTITFNASGDGGTEAFAWDNLVINSNPAGGCPNPMAGCDNSDIFPAATPDCNVDISDLGVVLANYAPGVGGKTRAQGDIFPLGGTGDGEVNLSDLGQLLTDFGTDCR